MQLEYLVERVAGAGHRDDGSDLRGLLRRAEGDQRPFAVADQYDTAEALAGKVVGPCRGVADEIPQYGVGHFFRLREPARTDAAFVVAQRGDACLFERLRQVEIAVYIAVARSGPRTGDDDGHGFRTCIGGEQRAVKRSEIAFERDVPFAGGGMREDQQEDGCQQVFHGLWVSGCSRSVFFCLCGVSFRSVCRRFVPAYRACAGSVPGLCPAGRGGGVTAPRPPFPVRCRANP